MPTNTLRNIGWDEDGLQWTFMSNLTSNINNKCNGYILVATIDKCMLMCKYNILCFVFYDFTSALSNGVSRDGMLESISSKLDVPTQLSVVELVNNISIILIFPNMDSIDDVFWMGEYKNLWNVIFTYLMQIDISHYYFSIIFIGSISFQMTF